MGTVQKTAVSGRSPRASFLVAYISSLWLHPTWAKPLRRHLFVCPLIRPSVNLFAFVARGEQRGFSARSRLWQLRLKAFLPNLQDVRLLLRTVHMYYRFTIAFSGNGDCAIVCVSVRLPIEWATPKPIGDVALNSI